jgi:Mg2+-importing ATPase
MFLVVCPIALGGPFALLDLPTQWLFVGMFQAGWFVESQWSQSLIIHALRTDKVPFIQSRASVLVLALTSLGILISTILPAVIGFGNGPISCLGIIMFF